MLSSLKNKTSLQLRPVYNDVAGMCSFISFPVNFATAKDDKVVPSKYLLVKSLIHP